MSKNHTYLREKADIRNAETPQQIEQAQRLFREYEQRLGIDLGFQNFEKELANLPGKYDRREGGRLLLAYAPGEKEAVGCVALRKVVADVCEMKRLYVRAEFRRLGVGRELIERVIDEARAEGYQKMMLDTIADKMKTAVGLYQFYGFREINSDGADSYPGMIFMEKMLSSPSSSAVSGEI